MLPKTRQDFTEYCLRRLGKPVIQINVSKEQVEDRVDDALEMYTLRHFDAMEERHVLKTLTFDDLQNNYIQMPPETIGVSEVFPINQSLSQTTTEFFNFQYLQAYNDYLMRAGIYAQTTGYSSFYIWQVNRNTMTWLIQPEERFEYNRRTQKLVLYRDLEPLFDNGFPIVMKCFLSVGEHTNLWADQWLRDYATTLVKRQWGENLKKYGGITLPSGATLNGEAMYQEAITELQRLEDMLKAAFELPSDFFMG